MQNNKKKCNDCIIGIFRNQNASESILKRIPQYSFPYAIKWYKYCPECGTKIDKNSYYLT